MDARLFDIMVCPVCKGPLQHDRNAQEFICNADKLAFLAEGLLGKPGPVATVDQDLACIGLFETQEATEQRALTSAAGTENSVNLAPLKAKVDSAQRLMPLSVCKERFMNVTKHDGLVKQKARFHRFRNRQRLTIQGAQGLLGKFIRPTLIGHGHHHEAGRTAPW